MDSESQASSKTQPELEGSTLNRQILSLAVPALGALIAEPLFATIDSAMVGHLGTLQLAGLGLASTILVTFFGVFIFLAYSTTAITSRALGAKRVADGLKAGIDAIWLALFLGIISTGVLVFKAEIIVTWFHPEPGVIPYAIEYLQFASPGLAGMMVVLAATGTLRGLLDTKTPLYVALGGAMVNTILNAILIYGLNLGVAGSGLGTAISQTLMGVVLVAIVVRAARSHDVDMKPSFGGLGSSIVVGFPLLIRTMSLRLAILATVAAVTRIGAIALSSHQAVVTLWNFAAYALDALGISAQALVGHSLGTKDIGRTRALLRRITVWGITTGALIGVIMIVASPWLPWIFTTDPEVHHATMRGLWVAGAFQALAGFVFMMDGILIGAGDNKFLAWAGLFTLVPYLPLLWLIVSQTGTSAHVPNASLSLGAQTTGLIWVWLAFGGVFMAARALTTGWRTRGHAWMH